MLGEYGTADGTHSADDIIGKLCDVAESHSGDSVVRVRAYPFCFLCAYLQSVACWMYLSEASSYY